jgi:hypothetical protein
MDGTVMGETTRKRLAGMTLTGAALFAVAACASGGGGKPATFHPGGTMAGAPAAAPGGAGAVTMPPFGKNAHIDMTTWKPADPSQAQAVLTDKNYELAYLYAEYTGGSDQSWTSYVNQNMQTEVQQAMTQPGIAGESFTGTIRFFDMQVFADPTVAGDLDVSSCFDNAQSDNTDLKTGKVIPSTVPAAQHYYRYTDQLAKDSAGSWQVIANLPPVYYPRAKECKP